MWPRPAGEASTPTHSWRDLDARMVGTIQRANAAHLEPSKSMKSELRIQVCAGVPCRPPLGGGMDFFDATIAQMAIEISIEKSFSFPTRLLSSSGSAVQASTSWSRNPARSLGQALVKNLGHDVLARSARTPVLSAMSALHAHRQRGHEDVFGFSSEAEIETHHPAKHSALELLAATR